MESCEVLVVGGGPGGSTCAAKLKHAGIDVVLLDKQMFPRQKPCAGWITPAVLDILGINADEYRSGYVLQDINSFRTGRIHGSEIITRYDKTISYGIRRSEFDQYLLQRSTVRHKLGEPVTTLERRNGKWIVNGCISARLVVGAGGHFCPVARLLGAKIGREDSIAAQVSEFAMKPDEERHCHIQADTPLLFFCRDMKGYGWLFRKGKYLNIGLGRMDRANLARHTDDFCNFLQQRGYLATGFSGTFQGHAYLLYDRHTGRDCIKDGVLLVGDAAGLAHPQSGEGILPAVESALLAADTILASQGDYRRDNLEPYREKLARRFDTGSKIPSSALSSMFSRFLGARLLSSSRFTRHVVLDRWFLHTGQKTLSDT